MDRHGVKALRERLGHTQAGFAELLPVANKTVSRWELGESSPSPMARLRMRELERKHKAANASENPRGDASTADTTETPVTGSSSTPRRRGILPSDL